MREITEDIKVGDKVVTRDGREGRVICTDARYFVAGVQLPIVACLKHRSCDEELEHQSTKSEK